MRSYVLDPSCRVRRERFGLLFYDLRGPKLLFAETGELLPPHLLEAGGDVAGALARLPEAARRRLERLLDALVVKGFLHEQ